MALAFVCMRNQTNPKRMKAALTGAFLCSVLGPTVGGLAILGSEVAHEHSAGAAVSAFRVLPWVWPVAVMLVGPVAFVLGGVGALIIQFMSARVPRSKALLLQTTAFGLVLGSAVPAVADVVFTGLRGSWNKNFATGLLPLGATTGVICAAATYRLLQRMGLLCSEQSHGSELV